MLMEISRGNLCDCFCAQCAQTRPRRAMPAAPWRTGLLLCFLGVRACLGEECVLGIVGRPVSLPCIHPELSTFVNSSIEWRLEDEVVLRTVWKEDGNVEEWSINRATIPADAAHTGNISLELPSVDPKQDNLNYSVSVISGQNQSAALCTVCLRIAASFSPPLLQTEEAARAGEMSFSCHSSGGFPKPVVYWLINSTQQPPEGSVRTLAAPLPESHLYNVTSYLTVNISKDSSVSCTIENLAMNETLTSTSSGVQGKPVVSRASEAMWIFSTGLCVVVGLMVLAGVVYQVHLDRISKRKKKEYEHQHPNRGNKRQSPFKEEVETLDPEGKETDV